MYRSGDRARRMSDGGLEYMGRLDDQVKLRGFRIELGEIEAALRTHPAVTDAVVLVRGEGDERRLVAWLVTTEMVSQAELRTHLSTHLPEYMVPSAFVVIDTLPLTPNGKVDRNALPEPDLTSSRDTDMVPPRTPLEAQIAAIWREVLGVERVGINDNFFALGGHSLLATQVVARLCQQFGREVALQ